MLYVDKRHSNERKHIADNEKILMEIFFLLNLKNDNYRLYDEPDTMNLSLFSGI